MSLFDQLKRQFSQQVQQQVAQAARTVTQSAGKSWTVTFARLPQTLEELQSLPEAALTEPHYTAALTVAALCAVSANREAGFAMLDFLRGPRPLSPREKQFITDRFMDGKGYIPRSYFSGATPDNDYTPTQPLTLKLYADPVGRQEADYVRLLLQSGGADSRRAVTLRKKPSTGQWFLWEQELLSGIRQMKNQDPWA